MWSSIRRSTRSPTAWRAYSRRWRNVAWWRAKVLRHDAARRAARVACGALRSSWAAPADAARLRRAEEGSDGGRRRFGVPHSAARDRRAAGLLGASRLALPARERPLRA